MIMLNRRKMFFNLQLIWVNKRNSMILTWELSSNCHFVSVFCSLWNLSHCDRRHLTAQANYLFIIRFKSAVSRICWKFLNWKEKWIFWNRNYFGLAIDVIESIRRQMTKASQTSNLQLRMNTLKTVRINWRDFFIGQISTIHFFALDLYREDADEEEHNIVELGPNRFKTAFHIAP